MWPARGSSLDARVRFCIFLDPVDVEKILNRILTQHSFGMYFSQTDDI
jgi:hypothetical protein